MDYCELQLTWGKLFLNIFFLCCIRSFPRVVVIMTTCFRMPPVGGGSGLTKGCLSWVTFPFSFFILQRSFYYVMLCNCFINEPLHVFCLIIRVCHWHSSLLLTDKLNSPVWTRPQTRLTLSLPESSWMGERCGVVVAVVVAAWLQRPKTGLSFNGAINFSRAVKDYGRCLVSSCAGRPD